MQEALGDGAALGIRLRYVVEPEPRGTAGALKYAEDLLEDRFLMLNGDVLTDLDLTAQIAQHEATGATGTLGLVPVEDPTAYGLVRLHDDFRVDEFLEKPDPDEIDTTLLIHPFVLTDFLDFNEFLDVADAAVEDMSLDGELQVANFHPDYQFADTDANDIGNYTNRAPYPILQLLREESIDRAVEAIPDAAEIFEKNIDTLEKLGHEGWDKLDVGPAR